MWDQEVRSVQRNRFGDVVAINDDGWRRRLPLGSLSVFRGMLERGERTPRDEFGGCGCFAGTEQLELDLVEEDRI